MRFALQEEDKPFVNRVYDWARLVEKHNYPRFSAFLNEREQFVVEFLLPSLVVEGAFWGGFDGAQRKMLILYPSWYYPAQDEYPFSTVQLRHLPEDTLSHRDVLGSLIGLGLSRESIGDILPQRGITHVLVTDPVKPVILENVKRIGRTGVKVKEGEAQPLQSVQQYSEKRGTVPSTRLDCLVGLLTGLSRDKSAALVQSELVQQNYGVERRPANDFLPGDIVTIRGYGKYIVDTIGEPTRKQRLPVTCRKYE